MTTAEELIANRLAGIQLGIFEIIWPAYPWIDQVAFRPNGRICSVHIQSHVEPIAEEWEGLTRLMRELFDVACDSASLHLVFEISSTGASERTHIVAMSDSLFKVIASKVAPWRLNNGR
ncbi:hypothetical protein [Cupriavidus sp. SS-3]|uniref:hypothetical protein n=1 Tax=Cupriavidus sp. SS-3 TaxID=3109596 RepID=UPI002DBA5B43|nr:hypothetical protein [Cupriavidus sp. SS-3]MEC3767504.1 hypothetical protein [Cupriavidus sp. SS-3]